MTTSHLQTFRNSHERVTAFVLFSFVIAIGYAPSVARALPSAGTIEGTAKVVDGDTIEIAGQRIRLNGIDAPEAAQTCLTADGQTWACGRQSAQVLKQAVAARQVACDNNGTDKYGRILGTCFVDAEELNDMLVRKGFAWAFVKYSQTYVAAEQAARATRAGVWSGENQPPWEYRQGEWRTAEATAPEGCAIKGNISDGGRIYHAPWSPWYGKVRIDTARGERWFCSEGEAVAAGWRASAAQ